LKNIILVGTGGFAAEIVEYIHSNQKHLEDFDYAIKGFLDINDKNHTHYGFSYPLLGSEINYTIDANDVFILCIGEIELMEIRKKIVTTLELKGATFINLIHHTVNVPNSTVLGEGNIIAPFSVIGPNSTIGDFNAINYHSSVAHDSSIGNYNILSPSTTITGWVNVGSMNFFGTSTSVIPSINIGDFNKIQSGVIVEKNIKDGSFVFSSSKTKQMILGSL